MEQLYPLESSWIVALAAGALMILMLWELSRSLPFQNLLMITVCLLAGEALLEYFLAKYARIELSGPMWRYLAGAALLWGAIVLTSRRMVQFIIRPWRREGVYGLWLIGLSALLTILFQFGWPCINIDPESDPLPSDKVATMAGIRGLVTVILLTCLVPFFIRKRPSSRKSKSQLAQEPHQEAK